MGCCGVASPGSLNKSIKELPNELRSCLRSMVVIHSYYKCIEEIVCNSLDAGATKVEILVDLSGKGYLEVSDNGRGMTYDELSVIGERYQIFTLKDLNEKGLYGYRGESLASIVNTCRTLDILCRTNSHEMKKSFEGGLISKLCVYPVIKQNKSNKDLKRTTISLADLFHKVPVRCKAMDRNHEQDSIKRVVESLALINFSVDFKLQLVSTSDNLSQNYEWKSSNSVLESVRKLIGNQKFVLPLESVEVKVKEAELKGCFGMKLDAGPRMEFLYFNRRPIVMADEMLRETRKKFSRLKKKLLLEKENLSLRDINDGHFLCDEQFLDGSILNVSFLFDFKVNCEPYDHYAKYMSLFDSCTEKLLRIAETRLHFFLMADCSPAFSSPKDFHHMADRVMQNFEWPLDRQEITKYPDMGSEGMAQSHHEEKPKDSSSKLSASLSLLLESQKVKTVSLSTPNIDAVEVNNPFTMLKNSVACVPSSRIESLPSDLTSASTVKDSLDYSEHLDSGSVDEFSPWTAVSTSGKMEDDSDVVPSKLSSSMSFLSVPSPNFLIQKFHSFPMDNSAEAVNIMSSVVGLTRIYTNDCTGMFHLDPQQHHRTYKSSRKLKIRGFRETRVEICAPGNNGEAPCDESHANVGLIRKSSIVFTKEMLASMKVIGQVDRKFIACLIQNEDCLVLVDQHAADERVRLEKFVKAIRIPAIGVAKTTQLRVSKEEIMMDESQECEGEIKGFSQQIMEGVLKSKPCLPQVEISLPLSTVAAMESLRDVFSRNGLKFRMAPKHRFDARSKLSAILITDIPLCCNGNQLSLKELIYECLERASQNQSQIPTSIFRHLCSLACHGAIKFGDRLSKMEMNELVRALGSCDLPFQCAHGRPTIIPLVEVGAVFRKNEEVANDSESYSRKLSNLAEKSKGS